MRILKAAIANSGVCGPRSAHRRTDCSAMPCLSLEAFYNPEWRRRTEEGERKRKGGLFLPRSNSHFAMSGADVPRFPKNAQDSLISLLLVHNACSMHPNCYIIMPDGSFISILKEARRNRDGEKMKGEPVTGGGGDEGKTRTTFLLFCRNEFYGVAQFPPTSRRCRGGWSPSPSL